ncbi:MAG: VanZ family protein [Micavibrio sp.]|nr:VanZ family protein [Micavibrio sp.]
MTAKKRVLKISLIVVWMICLVAMGALSLIPDLFKAGHNEDKNLHMLAYAVMTSGAMVVLPGKKLKICAIIGLFGMGWGIEYLQSMIGGRESSVQDGLANVMGMIIGCITGLLINSGYKKPTLSRGGNN